MHACVHLKVHISHNLCAACGLAKILDDGILFVADFQPYSLVATLESAPTPTAANTQIGGGVFLCVCVCLCVIGTMKYIRFYFVPPRAFIYGNAFAKPFCGKYVNIELQFSKTY